jgi:hypothetical protein
MLRIDDREVLGAWDLDAPGRRLKPAREFHRHDVVGVNPSINVRGIGVGRARRPKSGEEVSEWRGPAVIAGPSRYLFLF